VEQNVSRMSYAPEGATGKETEGSTTE
jgi:hypothetical protein